jgi:LAS superfamily LD-carboxypeptidase LdcB
VNGEQGTCIDTKVISCQGKLHTGKCPGAANIQCCVTASTSTGSADGLCGSYVGSTVSSIAGNGNVIYSVVKIRTEHLSNPSSYSLAPTDSDNTMTTTTACAFDQMASAAKAAGVTIKINSGFRTIARQEYFWDCYQTKKCNNGNLAAKPGTSNHGKGIALDLNTDCGGQTGAKPNCGGSAVYQWLYNNAHTYGFIRTVQTEPWHWEFRGPGSVRSSFS